MEQSTSDFEDFDFDKDEREVVVILLELPQLIAKSEKSLAWGFKRRRTAVPERSSHFRSPSLHSPRPPRPSVVVVDENSRSLVVEAEEPTVMAVQAMSPVTPLSLSLSESDENPECSKRSSSHKVFGPETEESRLNLASGFPRDTSKSPTVDPTPVIRHHQLFLIPDLNVSPPPPEYYFQALPFLPYLAKINRAVAAQRARQRRIGICRANKLRPRVR
ncbi:hypothetical protein HS088_TW12G00541 [Tripterygium wilfordii]|uniref:Uncharacterized protein n=1 Tax=Tripterygium wilfordii TaxID=458696 RepID=A0A7J7CZT8_TRIWF|nr:uncharacterized protein LOC120010067 [Tripterygium wilfordii]KAF5739336.1 hypothetical protein HS088_TW12G00541 [Tripterygium wilfordii]